MPILVLTFKKYVHMQMHVKKAPAFNFIYLGTKEIYYTLWHAA